MHIDHVDTTVISPGGNDKVIKVSILKIGIYAAVTATYVQRLDLVEWTELYHVYILIVWKF